jgi:hypothetical protein
VFKVSGILSLIFGNGGEMSQAFGGLGLLVAFFIFVFFILMLYSKNVSGENMVLFTFIFLLMIISTGLFNIPTQYIMIPIVLILLFLSSYAYYYFNKND